jgi:hypothetical protein
MKTLTEEEAAELEELTEKGRAFVDGMRDAYDKARAAGMEPQDLAGLLLCHAYATAQMTFGLDRPQLAGMIADTIRKYLASGAFERNRDFADHVGPMQ